MKKPEQPNPGEINPSTTVPFSAADLPINEDGRIYHLEVKPEQIAHKLMEEWYGAAG